MKLFDGGGRFLHVTKSGRYWRFKYRWWGKERLYAIGVYPSVSLAQARRDRDDARWPLAAGIDLSAKRRAEKTQRHETTASTLEAVARAWYEGKHRHEVSESHASRNWRRLELYVFPTLARPSGSRNLPARGTRCPAEN